MTTQFPTKQISDLKEMVKLDACHLADSPHADTSYTAHRYRHIAAIATIIADAIDHNNKNTTTTHQ